MIEDKPEIRSNIDCATHGRMTSVCQHLRFARNNYPALPFASLVFVIARNLPDFRFQELVDSLDIFKPLAEWVACGGNNPSATALDTGGFPFSRGEALFIESNRKIAQCLH